MMKSKFFLLLLLGMFLFSCDDDDSTSSSSTSNDLIGNWEMIGMNYNGTSTSNVSGQSFVTNFRGVGKDFDYTMEFTENPNEFSAEGTYTIALEYIFSGQNFTQDVPVQVNSTRGDWSLDGMTLTTSNQLVSYSVDGQSAIEDGQDAEAEITVNSNNLEFRINDTSTTIDSSTGARITQEVTSVVRFSRIN